MGRRVRRKDMSRILGGRWHVCRKEHDVEQTRGAVG